MNTHHSEHSRENRRRYHERRQAAARAAGHDRPWQAVDFWRHSGPNLCGICGGIIPGRRHASIDHIVPLSRGGTDAADNVQLAHKICNWRKGNNQPNNTRGQAAPLESLSA